MWRAIASMTICFAGGLCGQTAAAPHFEVASIKLSGASTNSTSGIGTGHGRLNANNVTLKRCIMGAWGVGPHQISGGPDWLDSDRFEIVAKADQPIHDDDALMVMLQSLLAERFKLALHRETRNMQALVLEVARNGPKMEKVDQGESVTDTSGGNSGVSMVVRSTTMDSFAGVLARSADLPVVNHTGLEGKFNFRLHWARERTDGAGDAPSLFTAIQEQLGLRLRSEKTAVEVLVVDHAERPSEN